MKNKLIKALGLIAVFAAPWLFTKHQLGAAALAVVVTAFITQAVIKRKAKEA
ncbi:hypothetical protein OAG1_15850 [Agarivorans sp. OAG1]|uniref:hypothetical protein n=1 Tax=unclassified Agarivorans TaxID=2636026 RepID=UPI002B2B045E|nr:hypothetical protein OAG1_15850 [Agarivorans sp. OAG1]